MSLSRAGVLAGLLAICCLPAWGDHSSELERARQRVRHAERRLSEAVHRLDDAQRHLVHVQQDHAAVVQACSRVEADLAIAQRALSEARRAIPLVQADLDNLERQLTRIRPQLHDAQAELAEAAAARENILSAALAELRAEPGFGQLLDEQHAAQAELDLTTARSLDVLAGTQQHQVAVTVLDRARARVDELRKAGPGAAQALAAASEAWMQRQNELNRLKESWLASDTRVGAARHRLTTVQGALRRMEEELSRRVALRPEVRAAELAVADAQADSMVLERELTQAEQTSRAAGDELARLRSVADQAAFDIDHLTREQERLRRSVSVIVAALADAQHAAHHAEQAERHARDELEAAQRELREAEQKEDAVRERERQDEKTPRHRDRADRENGEDAEDGDRDSAPRRGRRFRE